VGHFTALPLEISVDPSTYCRACPGTEDNNLVGGKGGNDLPPMSAEKSDYFIVAMKPGNAGGAKEVTKCKELKTGN
jgi:hypothetical protein